MESWVRKICFLITIILSISAQADIDTDGDGYSDLVEKSLGLNPNWNEFIDIPMSILGEAYPGGQIDFISPDGKHLYVNTATSVYDINQESGMLENFRATGLTKTYGTAMTSSKGDFIFVNPRYTGDILVYERDIKTGMLTRVHATSILGEIKKIMISPDNEIYFTVYYFDLVKLFKGSFSDDHTFTYDEVDVGIFSGINPNISFLNSEKYYLPLGSGNSTNKILVMKNDEKSSSIESSQYIFRDVAAHPLVENKFYSVFSYSSQQFYLSLVSDDANGLYISLPNNHYYLGKSDAKLLTDKKNRLLYVLNKNRISAFKLSDSDSEISKPELFQELNFEGNLTHFSASNGKVYITDEDRILILSAGQWGGDTPLCN